MDKEDDILCMRELTLAEMQKLRKAVAQEYYFQARQLGVWVLIWARRSWVVERRSVATPAAGR